MTINTTFRPLLDYGLQESVDLLNLGFSDYFVHIELTLPLFLNMARVESIDLGSSRVICLDDETVGIALIARRGWTSRLATMCIVPAARGRGAGRATMDALLADASIRGDHSMVLEVIEDNAPAVRLYEACGFKTERRLVAFEGSFHSTDGTAGLQDVDIREVARLVTMHGLDNLPWQISGESLAQAGAPSRAFWLEDAYAVISKPEAEQIALRSIVVQPESRRQGQATHLLKAILARYPNRKWLIPALCPEEVSGLFEGLGFKRDTLAQKQMRIQLNSGKERS